MGQALRSTAVVDAIVPDNGRLVMHIPTKRYPVPPRDHIPVWREAGHID